MRRPDRIRRIFHLPFFSRDPREEVEDEIDFHIRELTEKLVDRGWAPSDAHQEALRRFGNVDRIREECRGISKTHRKRQKMGDLLESIVQDIRFSLRSLGKNLSFTGFALGSLALGIGANIVVFTLFYTVLFEPLPYPDEDRLLYVEETAPAWEIDRMGFSYPDLVDFRAQTGAFTHLSGFLYLPFSLAGLDGAERVMGCQVSADFLEALSVRPMIGRGFQPDDEGEGSGLVALLSAGLWHRRYGGDPGILGRTISIGGEPATVVGVVPEFFRFPSDAELWVPFRASPTESRGRNAIGVVGRLRPGILAGDAETELNRIARELGGIHWGSTDALGARVTPLREWLLGDWRAPALAFYAVVCLVLLLACANVANLLIARNTTRREEMAVRASLGAGRSRIARQLLTEGITLTALGGLLGVGFGFFGRDLLLGLSPVDLPPYLSFAVQPAPVAIITLIIVGCGLLFSLGPALSASRMEVGEALRSESTRVSGHAGGIRLRSALVAMELAMALVVLIGGGLMFKSLVRQILVDPGFRPEGVVSARLDLPEIRYQDQASLPDFYRRLQARAEEIPGIERAAIASALPTGQIPRETNVFPEGAELASDRAPIYPLSMVSPGYFASLGIPLVAGRDFSDGDLVEDASRAVIVNETFARRHWHDQDPIGKRIARDDGPPPSDDRWFTIIGVVGNTFTDGYGQPIRPAIYLPIHREPQTGIYLVARTSIGESAAFEAVRAATRSLDPEIPISLPRTMDRALLEANWQVRFYTWLLGVFSLLAIFLASAGVYGVMSFLVASRSREFSLRMALGAEPARVEGLVVRRSMMLALVGLAAGLLVAVGGARLMTGLLFQVEATDLQVFSLATLSMAAVAFLAGWVPARRILRMDPMAHLRED